MSDIQFGIPHLGIKSPTFDNDPEQRLFYQFEHDAEHLLHTLVDLLRDITYLMHDLGTAVNRLMQPELDRLAESLGTTSLVAILGT